MAKSNKEAVTLVRDAIEAFVKSTEENYYAPEQRRKAVSRPYQELAGDRRLPLSLHRALASTDKKGVLYNLLMENRFSWEELLGLYDRLGQTDEAKVRLLRNGNAPVDFIKEMQKNPSPQVAEVIFSSPKMPVSEFEYLVARFDAVCSEMEELYPGASPYTGRNLSDRWEELRKERYLLEDSASKWCTNYEDLRTVIEVVDRTRRDHTGDFQLRRITHSTAKREDLTWDLVKEVCLDMTFGVAHSYITTACHKIPERDRAALISGEIKTTTYARLRCMESGNGKFKPKKLHRLLKMYDKFLDEQGEQDFIKGIKDSFMMYSKYWKGTPKFTSEDKTPVEELILANFEPTVAYNMGIVSFSHFLEETKKEKQKVARALELRHKNDEKSRAEYRELTARLLGPFDSTPQRSEKTLRAILGTEEGQRAWEEWLSSSEFAYLAEVPYDWALEVLI